VETKCVHASGNFEQETAEETEPASITNSVSSAVSCSKILTQLHSTARHRRVARAAKVTLFMPQQNQEDPPVGAGDHYVALETCEVSGGATVAADVRLSAVDVTKLSVDEWPSPGEDIS
jgi:hypothetical protein